MFGLFIVLHIFACILLIIIVLFQQPQKGGVTSILGGGESIFGGGGAAPFMTKLTSGLAILFMITSLSLVLISSRRVRPAQTRPVPESTAPAEEVPPLGE